MKKKKTGYILIRFAVVKGLESGFLFASSYLTVFLTCDESLFLGRTFFVSYLL